MMDLIDRTELLRHLDECIAEGDAQPPITNAVLLAIRCAVEQMPRVDSGIEWHKVSRRKITETDYDIIGTTVFTHKDVFLNAMPDDGQEVLVVMPWGTLSDTCIESPYGYGLLYQSGWQDAIAWAEMPKYEEEKEKPNE